jgi:hypothetical protein
MATKAGTVHQEAEISLRSSTRQGSKHPSTKQDNSNRGSGHPNSKQGSRGSSVPIRPEGINSMVRYTSNGLPPTGHMGGTEDHTA